MTSIFGICGASGSGKTTLLYQIIKYFVDQGVMVGVIKHHGHFKSVIYNPSGKDTTRLLEAGATKVILTHAKGINFNSRMNLAKLTPYELVEQYLSELDLILVENYKIANLDKIEVIAPGCTSMLSSKERLVALVRRGGGSFDNNLPVLDADNPIGIANFILEHLAKTKTKNGYSAVSLRVDGVKLPLKSFVAKLIEYTLRGLIISLKGGQKAETGYIELKIKKV